MGAVGDTVSLAAIVWSILYVTRDLGLAEFSVEIRFISVAHHNTSDAETHRSSLTNA
jgi:hypothetical protein